MILYATIKRLSEISELSENYLYAQMRCGALPHSRCGRAIRVSLDDFEAFMAAHRVGGAPQTPAAPRRQPLYDVVPAR